MVATVLVFAALFGLVFGSFVTALSYRLPRNLSIAHGRSGCPSCGHVLEWRDLFPVLSWVRSRGRCRHCGTSISVRYPVIELISAALFVGVAAAGLGTEHSLILLAMTPVLLAVAVIDFERGLVPNILMALLAVLAAIWRWRTGVPFLQGLGVAAGVAILAVVLEISARWVSRTATPVLGGGDTKLLAVAALALSLPHFFLFLTIAGLLGCVFGVIWQKTKKTSRFPFAPGICLALWAVMEASQRLPF